MIMEAEATVVKKKVLIIEDSAFISRVLESRFIEEGFEVSVCLDGESGLMAAKSKKPDLIILDLILPKLSGEAVCKEIRKDEELKAVPVVMLTAKNSEADKIIGRVIGADKYLPKPLDADKLFKEVRELI
jgi:DNA-binding response OmpR family regulator